MEQLNTANIKNVKHHKSRGTRGQYSYRLWKFHDWLVGQNFEFQKLVQVGENMFERKKQNITIMGIDHFLELYQGPNSNHVDFIKIIKKYLLDPVHTKQYSSTVNMYVSVLKSFFKENNSEINFTFNSKAKYKTDDGDEEQRELRLDDLMKILTIGKPTITEKAVILCKFHR